MTSPVITADDFGLCASIDDAICRLHDRGVVGRTSLVVNTPFFESSLRALRARPALEVAIHLNLTDGRPVLAPAEVPTLVDGRGEFGGGRHYGVVARIASGRISRDDVQREWRAQIVKARHAGVPIRELNSHGHLHLLPHLHGIVLALRREFDIPQVRLVHSLEWPRGVILQACSRLLRRALRRDGVELRWPDRTLGLRHPGAVDPAIALHELASNDSPRVEIIVHPSTGRNPYHDRWGYRGEDVMEWLLGAASHNDC